MYNKIILFTKYSRKYILFSIPKNYFDIRVNYSNELYNLPKYMLYATYNKGNIRLKYLNNLQVTISLLDYLLIQIKDINYIKSKYVNNAIALLTDIKNIVYGWRFSEEKK